MIWVSVSGRASEAWSLGRAGADVFAAEFIVFDGQQFPVVEFSRPGGAVELGPTTPRQIPPSGHSPHVRWALR